MSTLMLRALSQNAASMPPPTAAEVLGSSFALVLPTDILLCILSVSSPAPIRRCQQVCRFLRDMIRADAYIQYWLQLDTCGYVESLTPRTGLSYAEKTGMLRNHNARWRNPNTATPVCYELPPGRAVGAHTFVKGTLMWNSEPGECDHQMNFYQLPSGNKGTGFKRWSIDLVEFQGFHSLWVDPEQELLVVVLEASSAPDGTTYELHLRSTTTGYAHPEAHSQHVLSYTTPTGSAFEAMRVGIVGRSLAVISPSSWPSAVDAVVWDWTTGRQLMYLSHTGSSSMELLSEDSFVIAHLPAPPNADTDVPKDTLGWLNVYRFGLQNATPAEATHIASFALPPNLHGTSCSEIKIYSSQTATTPNFQSYAPRPRCTS